MADLLSADHKQGMISSFLEIAVGQTADTARQFLQATGWKLDEAIQLFYVDNEGSTLERQSDHPATIDGNSDNAPNDSAGLLDGQPANTGQSHGEDVRAPLPVKRDVLYDDPLYYASSGMSNQQSSVVAFRNFEEETKRSAVWESGEDSTSTAENPRDNLASLYRPPFHLMFHGTFEKAKGVASLENKWLIVNVQSNREFSSHMLNRDTWANEAVAQTISTNFVFWQVSDDTIEGGKVRTFYKLDSFPVVLVIDPITGQKIQSWCGMIQPESLLEDLMPFMEDGPKSHRVTLSHKRPREKYHPPQKSRDNSATAAEIIDEDAELQAALAASMGIEVNTAVAGQEEEVTCSTEEPSYPPLPEEPKGDRSLLCRVGVRLPDGRRVQRNFLRSDPIQLLWSFCRSHLGDAEKRPFRLAQAIPGASRSLDYKSDMTFGEAGIANSMISVTWE
ncbi:hypothetical protein MLD38_003826 [Melastoma candidum]|uniref:Uncharacterized protein n=1 Tax=Melastoma candidum TaxID=119954 RepID=A0ACB9S7M9_9MYRT|nr:hypothetical protein MLD38_003826 [Melastoma candidum]